MLYEYTQLCEVSFLFKKNVSMAPFFSVSLCVVDQFQHITPISFVESAVPENTKRKKRAALRFRASSGE